LRKTVLFASPFVRLNAVAFFTRDFQIATTDLVAGFAFSFISFASYAPLASAFPAARLKRLSFSLRSGHIPQTSLVWVAISSASFASFTSSTSKFPALSPC